MLYCSIVTTVPYMEWHVVQNGLLQCTTRFLIAVFPVMRCVNAGLKDVVVTRKAGEAVLRGAPVFAPGVLAMSKHLVEGDVVAVSIAREIPGNLPSSMSYVSACLTYHCIGLAYQHVLHISLYTHQLTLLVTLTL